MEQADIQRLQNLVEAIQKKAPWELDDKFRKLLDDTINYKLLTVHDNKLYYDRYPIKILVDNKDVINWRNRKVDIQISTTVIKHFNETMLTSLLRNKLVLLTDDLLVLCTTAHITASPEEIAHQPYFNEHYGFRDMNDPMLNELPVELRKQLTFYKSTEKKAV